MSLPRTAEAAVIRNLSLGGSTGDSNNETLAHYIQINLKSSGNIVVQGETRSFTVSDLEKFKGTLAVVGDASVHGRGNGKGEDVGDGGRRGRHRGQ